MKWGQAQSSGGSAPKIAYLAAQSQFCPTSNALQETNEGA
jgi:hypothetical protein